MEDEFITTGDGQNYEYQNVKMQKKHQKSFKASE
jgi:hypothetical protein